MVGTSPAMTKHDTITSLWIAPKKPAPTLQPAKWAAPHRCLPYGTQGSIPRDLSIGQSGGEKTLLDKIEEVAVTSISIMRQR